MEIMVTGGAGYIGSVLVERLIEEGHRPIVFDNLQTGHRAAVHPDARFFRGDVRNRADLDRAFGDYPCEATIHLAANSVVEESVNDPSKYFEVNVGGGINLLRAMLDHGVLRLIFSSTAAVYGEPDEVPIDETAATRPTNPYGVSKLMFERVLDAYADAYDLHFVALRYFNAAGASRRYGPDQPALTHLIPRVLKVALGARDSIELFGTDYPTPDGTAVRDYIHVEDLAEAHIRALDIGGKRAVFNLGYEKGYSVREVVDAAADITGRPIPLVEKGRRAGDPAMLVASSRRILEQCGWRAARSDLRMIVQSAWDWHQAHPDGYGH